MKKNGFSFIETIVTIVVLSTSLLLLYNSYTSIISSEEDRLYYDDVAYMYKTSFVKKFLEEYTTIDKIKEYAFLDNYVVTIGTGYRLNDGGNIEEGYGGIMNDAADISLLANVVNDFNINQMIIIDSSMFYNCPGYSDDSTKCQISRENISYSMQRYLRTLNDVEYDYYLVVEYSEKLDTNEDGTTKFVKCIPGIDTYCHTFYASLGI